MPGDPLSFVGIDPGFKGAMARITLDGRCQVWDLPVDDEGKDRQREFNLHELHAMFRRIRAFPSTRVAIEWPTTRPGEGAERAERFGRGKGYLEAFAFSLGLDYIKVPPNLWKGRLGLPGKDHPGANDIGASLFRRLYPAQANVFVGPRGGILDGRLDALLIAHYLRTRNLGGTRNIVDQFGKGSIEAQVLILSGGSRRRKVRKGGPVF